MTNNLLKDSTSGGYKLTQIEVLENYGHCNYYFVMNHGRPWKLAQKSNFAFNHLSRLTPVKLYMELTRYCTKVAICEVVKH
jgi:hypothetical protein